jgi:hypothetical protein
MKRRERDLLDLLIQQHERHCQELNSIIAMLIRSGQYDTAADEGIPAPTMPGLEPYHVAVVEPAEHLKAYR